MNIGYACLTVGIPFTDLKSCVLKNFNEASLKELIGTNLCALNNIIDYNIKNGIKLFRICSELIPFGSHHTNIFPWWIDFAEEFSIIAKKLADNNIIISMHPGQYTLLNSPKSEVTQRAIEDLEYHKKLLECLGGGDESKLVLHIGGIYGDKESAIERFKQVYNGLEQSLKANIIIENDDRYYNIKDVYNIGIELGIPVVFDNLHHSCNPCADNRDEPFWIKKCEETFNGSGRKQKIHYSQQNELKRNGSHSKTINANEFLQFFRKLENKDIDIMLEVKDKNLSAIKIMNCLDENKNIAVLEKEWAKYKYSVLECSPSSYLAIRTLLKDKKSYPVTEFYEIIDNALIEEISIGNAVNAALHIWGYFKDKATDNEKKVFFRKVEQFEKGSFSIKPIKNLLWRYTNLYQENYLLESYYFWL